MWKSTTGLPRSTCVAPNSALGGCEFATLREARTRCP